MKLNIIVLLALLAIFASCTEDDTTPASPASPTHVKVYLHDQPVDYQEVNIDLQSIEFKGAGAGEIVLEESYAGIYDLLDLQNGLDTLIGDTVLNFSNLSQIRLILGPNNTVMVNDTLYPLETPSAQQSGLKINVQAALSNMDSLVISLDFDAAESVHQLGNGTYQMHPVIKLD
jgi:hypothetical protein